jgi:thioesterase domain-containing protein
VLYARELARHLQSDQPVFAFQSRYVAGVPAFSRVEEMASAYVRELLSFSVPGPYFILGYCFGGLVGLEMAFQLNGAAKSVAVGMLDTPAPGSLQHWPFPGLRHVPLRVRFLFQDLIAAKPQQIPGFIARKARGATQALLANRKAFPRFRRPSLPQVSAQKSPIWRVNLAAARAYAPRPFSGDIAIFVTPEAPHSYDFDLRDGWAKYAESLRVINVPGNVTTVMREPYVQSLAIELTKWMAHGRLTR